VSSEARRGCFCGITVTAGLFDAPPDKKSIWCPSRDAPSTISHYYKSRGLNVRIMLCGRTMF
jgi:hypothetical protein